MASSWHYSVNGRQVGPVSSDELSMLAEEGTLSRDDLVWRIGMDQWEPARKVKDLFRFSATERVVERDAISIGEFFQFTEKLPTRDVVMNFSDGTSNVVPLSQIRSEFSASSSTEHVYDTTGGFVLNEIRSQDGWLCLKFGSSFQFIQSQILEYESEVSGIGDAKLIVNSLRRIDAMVELGITRDQLQSRLADGWLDAKDFEADCRTEFPKFAALITGAYDNYRVGLELWNQGAAEIPIEFTGGGFGLVGAAKGMAVGIGLQSLVNKFNNNQSRKLDDRLRGEFWYASQKIKVAHNVIRQTRVFR